MSSDATWSSALQGTIEANVPARALQELARIAQSGREPELAVSVGQNQVVFELGEIVLSSRLIDGQFPNYRQLLPESVEHELRLSSAEFTDVVRRVSLLAQKNAPLRLELQRGRADGFRANARCRRGERDAPGAISRASRSRSASTRSSCATAWRASTPTSWC